MTFEKALEAMRNGKRVTRKGLGSEYELCMFKDAIIRYPFLNPIPYLRTGDISACDWEISGEWLKEGKEMADQKKCECNCERKHGADTNMQVKMEQELSRKFFELADTTTDSLAVSNMIEIYRLLFEVK
jgi:hypothetical protein